LNELRNSADVAIRSTGEEICRMKVGLSKKILVLFIVFLLGFGVGVGGTIVKDKFLPAENNELEAAETNNNPEPGPLHEMEEFLVNLEGGGMIRAEITIEGVNSKSEEEIISRDIFLRDRVIQVFSSKVMEDVSSTQGQENLKKELVTELNEVCPGKIKDVLFKNFVYTT